MWLRLRLACKSPIYNGLRHHSETYRRGHRGLRMMGRAGEKVKTDKIGDVILHWPMNVYWTNIHVLSTCYQIP